MQAPLHMSRFTRKLTPVYPLHVTGRCNNRENFPIQMTLAWEIFSDYLFAIHQRYEIEICSFVLMSNHFHLICLDPKLNLSKAMALFMKETSCEIGRLSKRKNRLWGAPYHSSIISSPLYYLHAYKYNYRNPVAAGICDKVEAYPWSTLQVLLGEKRGVIPIVNDETLLPEWRSTLDWLNHGYSKDEVNDLKVGFQKKIFELPVEATTKRKNRLSSPESLPNFCAVNCEMLGGTFNSSFFIASGVEHL